MGPLRVNSALVQNGKLADGCKLITISSQAGSAEWRFTQNNDSGGDYVRASHPALHLLLTVHMPVHGLAPAARSTCTLPALSLAPAAYCAYAYTCCLAPAVLPADVRPISCCSLCCSVCCLLQNSLDPRCDSCSFSAA